MSEFRWVRLDGLDGGIRLMTLDKPKVNALGREMVDDLTGALELLHEDAAARCLIVRTAGKHFCAGADLKERKGMTVDDVLEFVPKLAGVCNGLAALPFPTIAAIRGAAAGGGCELALACDLRILAEDVKIGLPETSLAIIPGAGGTQRLPRLIGPSRAKRWIFGAGMYDAAAALADGVADRVVSGDELDDEAQKMASAIAAGGPVAVRLAKLSIDDGASLALDEALVLEWNCYQGTLQTSDRVEALEAFDAKREPRFRGK